MPLPESISEDDRFIYAQVDPHAGGREILAFLSEAFGLDFSYAEYEWFKLRHPYSRSRVYVAYEKSSEVLAAAVCSQTFTYRIGGEKERISLLVSGATHRDYRRLGIFSRIVNLIVDYETPMGIGYGVSLPNPYTRKSFQGFIKAGWKAPIEFRFFEKREFEAVPHHGVKIERFDEEFDLLIERAARPFDFFHLKDRRILNWRYLEKPDTRYDCFAIDENGLKGLVVLKKFSSDGRTRIHMVDFLALDPDVADRLISMAEYYARESDLLNVCLTTGSRYESLFLKRGFKPGTETYPVVMKTSGRASIPEFSAPWLTMGDFDTY